VRADSGLRRGASRQQLGDDLRVHRRSPRRDPPHCLGEVTHIADAVLEQVTDAAVAVGKQLAGVELLNVLGQDQYRETRLAAAGLDGGP